MDDAEFQDATAGDDRILRSLSNSRKRKRLSERTSTSRKQPRLARSEEGDSDDEHPGSARSQRMLRSACTDDPTPSSRYPASPRKSNKTPSVRAKPSKGKKTVDGRRKNATSNGLPNGDDRPRVSTSMPGRRTRRSELTSARTDDSPSVVEISTATPNGTEAEGQSAVKDEDGNPSTRKANGSDAVNTANALAGFFEVQTGQTGADEESSDASSSDESDAGAPDEVLTPNGVTNGVTVLDHEEEEETGPSMLRLSARRKPAPKRNRRKNPVNARRRPSNFSPRNAPSARTAEAPVSGPNGRSHSPGANGVEDGNTSSSSSSSSSSSLSTSSDEDEAPAQTATSAPARLSLPQSIENSAPRQQDPNGDTVMQDAQDQQAEDAGTSTVMNGAVTEHTAAPQAADGPEGTAGVNGDSTVEQPALTSDGSDPTTVVDPFDFARFLPPLAPVCGTQSPGGDKDARKGSEGPHSASSGGAGTPRAVSVGSSVSTVVALAPAAPVPTISREAASRAGPELDEQDEEEQRDYPEASPLGPLILPRDLHGLPPKKVLGISPTADIKHYAFCMNRGRRLHLAFRRSGDTYRSIKNPSHRFPNDAPPTNFQTNLPIFTQTSTLAFFEIQLVAFKPAEGLQVVIGVAHKPFLFRTAVGTEPHSFGVRIDGKCLVNGSAEHVMLVRDAQAREGDFVGFLLDSRSWHAYAFLNGKPWTKMALQPFSKSESYYPTFSTNR